MSAVGEVVVAQLNPIHALFPRTELLPFRVEIASQAQMEGVLRLRAASYGKYIPELGARLRETEAADEEIGCEVFVATSKLDGSVLGSLRSHANVFNPLPVQHSLSLPPQFRRMRLLESTRLCVKDNSGSSVVRSALFKAVYLYSLSQHVDWVLATGRRPMDRLYENMQFQDVGSPGVFYPMHFSAGVPHRVMYMAPESLQPLWHASRHQLYRFFIETHHPDIDLTRAKPLLYPWQCPEVRTLQTIHGACDLTSMWQQPMLRHAGPQVAAS